MSDTPSVPSSPSNKRLLSFLAGAAAAPKRHHIASKATRTPPAEESAVSSDSEDKVGTKKDKGKGKMRVMPELPSEVWERIFDIYYETCADGELSV